MMMRVRMLVMMGEDYDSKLQQRSRWGGVCVCMCVCVCVGVGVWVCVCAVPFEFAEDRLLAIYCAKVVVDMLAVCYAV